MKELVEVLAKALVDHPEEVNVTERRENGETVRSVPSSKPRPRRPMSGSSWTSFSNMLTELEIGVVISTHGLKGEVNVFPLTDEAGRFRDLKTVLLRTPEGDRELTVSAVRFFKGRPILRFREITSIEEAEKLRRMTLLVKRDQAVPLKENEFFIGDLIGSDVFLEDGSRYGTLTDVLRTGANDVYAIDTGEGNLVYLPAIRDCVLSIAPEEKRITVRPMKEI